MKNAALSAALVSLALVAGPAAASGSGSGSGSGSFGGFRGGSNVSNIERARIQEAQRLIRRGKSQVRKRITCKKCEYHDRLDKNNAYKVAVEVIDGGFGIKEEDRTAVVYYLRDRYRF